MSEVYRYDDAGEPVVLSTKEKQFKELWSHIDALDLSHLNPSMNVDKPLFDPSVFLQKISWAHAELGVVLDVIDGILTNKSLRIQPISNHSMDLVQTSRDTSISNIDLACSIFAKAKSDIRDSQNELGELNRLISLRKAGWPLFKIGLNWFANYGYQIIINQPLDMLHVIRINSLKMEPAKLLRVTHSQFGSLSISKMFLAAAADALSYKLFSTLDAAIFNELRRSFSDRLLPQSSGHVLYIPHHGGPLQFECVCDDQQIQEGPISSPLADMLILLYRNFIYHGSVDL